MMSKDCRVTRREIDELELHQRLSDHARTHLDRCAPCSQFRAERTELRELVGSLEPISAPADFEMRLRARLAADRSSSRQQPFFARLMSTPALAAAALFVAVAGSVVWIAQRNPSSTGTNPPAVAGAKSPSTATTPNATATSASNATGPTAGPDVVAVNSPNNPRRQRGQRMTHSNDFDVQPAGTIRTDDGDRAYVPSRRVEFAVEDARGNTRKISLPPVSFGAQSLVDNRTSVAYSPNTRVW